MSTGTRNNGVEKKDYTPVNHFLKSGDVSWLMITWCGISGIENSSNNFTFS
jgi:hypothetical protein